MSPELRIGEADVRGNADAPKLTDVRDPRMRSLNSPAPAAENPGPFPSPAARVKKTTIDLGPLFARVK